MPLDGDGRIRNGLPCPGCGYDLRGQPASGVCPECGRPFEASALLTGLAVPDETPAHRVWRERVESGPRWLGRGMLWLPAGFIVFPAGLLPVLPMLAVGMWRITAREPAGPHVPHEGQAAFLSRLIARWFTVLMTAGIPLALWLAMWMAYSRRGVGGDGWRLVDTLVSGSILTYLIGLMFGWRHLFDLTARAGRPQESLALKRLWRTYFNAILAGALLAAAVAAGDVFLDRRLRILGQPADYVGLGAAAVCVLGLGVWVWGRTVSVLRGLRLGGDATGEP